MTKEYQGYKDYLAHYGVKGQKWGNRQWQNEDGTYTEAGKHHYGWGYGRQNTGGMSQPSAGSIRAAGAKANSALRRNYQNMTKNTMPQRREPTQEEIEARKERARTILKVAGGVALAAALAYGVYRGGKAFKTWRRAGNLYRGDIRTQKNALEFKRRQSMDVNGWTKSAEKRYWKEQRAFNRRYLKSFITRRKRWGGNWRHFGTNNFNFNYRFR